MKRINKKRTLWALLISFGEFLLYLGLNRALYHLLDIGQYVRGVSLGIALEFITMVFIVQMIILGTVELTVKRMRLRLLIGILIIPVPLFFIWGFQTRQFLYLASPVIFSLLLGILIFELFVLKKQKLSN